MKKCSEKVYAGDDIPFDDIKNVIVTIEEFIDRYHHSKNKYAYLPATNNIEPVMNSKQL